MAFYHALPSAFWDEVVHDYQLGAILDVAVGDGSLALTAVRNRIAYTGLCFTTHHKDMVMSRLLDLMSAGSLKAGDKWYDPNLVKTLLGASKKNKATVDPDGSVAPKKNRSQTPRAPRTPRTPRTPRAPRAPRTHSRNPRRSQRARPATKKIYPMAAAAAATSRPWKAKKKKSFGSEPARGGPCRHSLA